MFVHECCVYRDILLLLLLLLLLIWDSFSEIDAKFMAVAA